MLLRIEPNSDTSIYRQLAQQVREEIACGRLKRGDRLPSLRQVAHDLVINHLTVKQAYDILENDGLIETRRGLGTFVRADADVALKNEISADLLERLRTAAVSAQRAGLDRKAFDQLVREAWNHSENPL